MQRNVRIVARNRSCHKQQDISSDSSNARNADSNRDELLLYNYNARLLPMCTAILKSQEPDLHCSGSKVQDLKKQAVVRG